MKNKNKLIIIMIILLLVLILLITYFIIDNKSNSSDTNNNITTSSTNNTSSTESNITYNINDLLTDRDKEQNVDTSNAKTYTVSDNKDIKISEEGIYVIKGSAKNVTIYVEVEDEDKVQLVLDNLTITNESMPAIYIKSADKVFITSVGSSNLSVTNTFKSDGDTNLDGVIFSKSDLVLNGTGTINVQSSDNAIVSKDDLKITGGTYVINATSKGLEAHDSIVISDGNITITSGTDGMQAKYDEDDTHGYIYISGGNIKINAGDDGIRATTTLQIEGGSIEIDAVEGLESTYVLINNGNIKINASDDGINATNKSSKYSVKIEINGGDIKIQMGNGDTDAIDSNGDLSINGGTIDINAQSPFDYDGNGSLSGATVTVNGNEITELTNQMMGGRDFNGNRRQR